ncbi:outer membrane protein [Ensifer soli]|uniref:outer membrane protein n=1 Tax=Ciceribacter sp. sgz301302 TaxID=3342379 RepID=UPI0035B9021E
MKTVLVSVVTVLLSGASTFAADLYQPVEAAAPIIEQPEAVVETSGWYLRGDVGYSFNKLRGAHFYQGSNGYRRDFDKADVDNSYTIGGGVGYQANRYLRADLTVDYLGKSDFRGATTGSCGVDPFACTSRDRASFSGWSVLANAYVDLGTYYSITPYVGAGLGGTRISWSNLKNTSCSDADPTNCDPTMTHKGKDSWRFTYAVMAGAAVDVTCNLKADVGYRYRRVLGGDMFGYKAHGGPGSDKGFNLHEVRAGLRYSFGGCPEEAYVAPPVVDYPVEQPVYK